jgi:catechol 2,3-dioxygenase-like lactoylglutathione lyase family enzyme
MLAIWHVAFPVADLDRSVAFYCDVLGFDLVGRDADSAFVALGSGGFTLELMAGAEERAVGIGVPDHVAFEAPDLDAFREGLVRAGLAVPEVQVIAEGLKRFALQDPDGLRLDVFQGRAGFEAFIAGVHEESAP